MCVLLSVPGRVWDRDGVSVGVLVFVGVLVNVGVILCAKVGV